MLIRILSILFPLFAIAAVGYAYGRRKRPDMSFANQLNMDVFVPALVFAALANKSFEPATYKTLALGALLLILGTGALGWVLARALRIAPNTLVPPLMFNNCGNLGLPLAVLAFGDRALAPAVVLFMISNFLHFSLGVYMLDHQARLSNLWRMPVMLATLGGLVVSFGGVEIWPPLMLGIRMLGDISIPLLLFALGVRLCDASLAGWRVGVLGAVARPLLGMALAALIARALGMEGLQAAMLLVFGALPPAVLNYVFAERFHQEPEKVASIVLIGNLAALVFLPAVLAIALP